MLPGESAVGVCGGERPAEPAAERAQRTEQRIGRCRFAPGNQGVRLEHVEKGTHLVAPDATAFDELRECHVAIRHVAQHAPVGDAVERWLQLRPRKKTVFFHATNDSFYEGSQSVPLLNGKCRVGVYRRCVKSPAHEMCGKRPNTAIEPDRCASGEPAAPAASTDQEGLRNARLTSVCQGNACTS